MKQNYLYIILIIILFSALQSCEDNFNPYGEYQKKYSLNCIIRGDTSLQVTTIFQNFPPSENVPGKNITDYFVSNAYIHLWSGNDEIYLFRDTVITDSNSNTINKYYYTNILPPKENSEIEINALLPDGNRLKSKTIIPNKIRKDLSRTTEEISSATRTVSFAWLSDDPEQIYIPTLYLYYQLKSGDKTSLQTFEIPWKYQTENGVEVPINQPPSKSMYIEYNLGNIEKALEQIAQDVNKANITILSVILEVKVLDKNLSTYYLSSGRLFDNYSIRLDEKDFTNIEGGKGIFGSFIVQKIAILFSQDYLIVHGYKEQ